MTLAVQELDAPPASVTVSVTAVVPSGNGPGGDCARVMVSPLSGSDEPSADLGADRATRAAGDGPTLPALRDGRLIEQGTGFELLHAVGDVDVGGQGAVLESSIGGQDEHPSAAARSAICLWQTAAARPFARIQGCRRATRLARGTRMPPPAPPPPPPPTCCFPPEAAVRQHHPADADGAHGPDLHRAAAASAAAARAAATTAAAAALQLQGEVAVGAKGRPRNSVCIRRRPENLSRTRLRPAPRCRRCRRGGVAAGAAV